MRLNAASDRIGRGRRSVDIFKFTNRWFFGCFACLFLFGATLSTEHRNRPLESAITLRVCLVDKAL